MPTRIKLNLVSIAVISLLILSTFGFAQQPKFSLPPPKAGTTQNDFYFCTDETIALIYDRVGSIGKLFITSFTSSSKIHIAKSGQRDRRAEGDGLIFINTPPAVKSNFYFSLRLLGSVQGWSKPLVSFDWLSDPDLGRLDLRDKVKFTLRRISDDKVLKEDEITPISTPNYLFVSQSRVFGDSYGCGRGISIVLERLNTPPQIIEGAGGVDINFDLNRKKLKITFQTDESTIAIVKITPENITAADQLTGGLAHLFEIDLADLKTGLAHKAEIQVKDTEGLTTNLTKSFQGPSFDFAPPKFFAVLVPAVGDNNAIVQVLTSRINDSTREIGTESILRYGISQLNQTQTTIVNATCKSGTTTYDCAIHRLTQLISNSNYAFGLTLKDKAGNEVVLSRPEFSFKTAVSDTLAPQIRNIKFQLLSFSAINKTYALLVSLQYKDVSWPVKAEVRFDNNIIETKPTNPTNGTANLNFSLKNIDAIKAHELKVKLIDAKNNLRELIFPLPKILD